MDEEEFDDETVDTSEEIDGVEGSSSSDDEEDVNVKSRLKKSATSDDDEDDVGFVISFLTYTACDKLFVVN